MAVCVSADYNEIGAQFGYGNTNSYTGEFLEGGNGDAQGANSQPSWPTPSPGESYWQDLGDQQDYGLLGPHGEFGTHEWSGGPWPQSLGSNGGGPDWRLSRGPGYGMRPKRRFCTSYPDISMCRRGNLCAFAHSREEISAPLLDISEEQQEPSALTDDFFMYKYKTRWCPIGVQHEWHTCVYAHNYQDARRPVNIGYGARLCPYWSKKDTGAEYSQRCPLGLRCPYSHGAKEQLYHPHYFKTVVCRDLKGKACPRQQLCAFFHHRAEKRVTPNDEVDYSQPLNNEALPEDWISDFLSPPFLPETRGMESSRAGGCGCGGGPASMEERDWYSPENMGPSKNVEGMDNGANGNAVVQYGQQMQNGATPGGQFGGPQMPCVILLPIGNMMQGPPGSPGPSGGGQPGNVSSQPGNGGMNPDMAPLPPAAGAMPGLPPNWVFVPMDGNNGNTY